MTNICFILSFITIRVTPVNYNIHICPHYWTIYWTKTQCTMNINLVIIISLFICWLSGVTILWQKTSVMVDVCCFRNKRWRNNSCCLSRLDCLNVELQRWFYCTSVPAEVGDDTLLLCSLSLKQISKYMAFITIYRLITSLTIVCRMIITSLIFNPPLLLTSI